MKKGKPQQEPLPVTQDPALSRKAQQDASDPWVPAMIPTMFPGGGGGGGNPGGNPGDGNGNGNNGPADNNNQPPHRPQRNQGRPQRQRGRPGGTLMMETIPLHPTPAVMGHGRGHDGGGGG